MDKTKKEGNMKRLKILAVVLALMVGLCVFSGCSDAEVKLGLYYSKDGSSLVTVTENELDFSYNVAVSYIPYGPYTIKYNRLTLQVGGGDFAGEYVFKISGDRLIFLSGPPLVARGTVFTFEGE